MITRLVPVFSFVSLYSHVVRFHPSRIVFVFNYETMNGGEAGSRQRDFSCFQKSINPQRLSFVFMVRMTASASKIGSTESGIYALLSCAKVPPQTMLFARNTNHFSMIRATAAVRSFSPNGFPLAPCAYPEKVILGLFSTNGGPNAWIKAVSSSDKSKTMGILTSIAPHPPSS